MHNILLLEEDGLKQQKTALGAAPVSQEKETEAMIHIGLLKLGNGWLEKCCLMNLDFCYNTWIVVWVNLIMDPS